jgi:threonylcarbamoyladenosine tRNA methylthiotransferase MtaB
MKRVAFRTLGCRLNQAETAMLAGQFEALGFEVTRDAADADVVVLHSCAVTRSAEHEGLRLVRQARRRGQRQLLVFTGCGVAVASPDVLRDAGVDLVVPQRDKADLPARVAAALGDPAAPPVRALPRFTTTRALVKVQDGCDFRCTYCIVPDARGGPRSRPFDEVLAEAHALAATGYREIILTGVNVACYRDGGRTLTDLVRGIARDPAILRIRLSSIEPATTEHAIVDLAVAESKLCHTLHYPLQSGDAGILRAMRRRYTPEQYADAVQYALDRVPNLGLGADVITGFPGEDDRAFAATRAMLERFPFSNVHVFPYSERPGTPAAALPNSVPVAVRRARARDLIALASAKRSAFAAALIGREVSVLAEHRAADGVARGWTGEYLEARIANAPVDVVGRLIRVVPTAVADDRLLGRLS